ncbi:hypothetical protein [Streptomyces aidingensis]|uniref:Uncharacterized protein n=1 Tax=Streptomyces aidingensis TaxID=910347 RepID=A0A1I1Q034_9ACTN|nr:hypothetical protein [Streptomyces aidingensis]SFD15506.1 hypothetical protein SAMN05421773_110190 [Streptomyces aidingensis]
MAQQRGARSARDHALAVLRVRNTAVAVALLPAAVAAVVLTAQATGRLPGGWTPLRWTVLVAAGVLSALAVAIASVIVRARPPVTPTVAVPEESGPALHGLIRELAARLGVPPPGGIALTPDCDSWLEEPAHRRRPAARRARPGARYDDGEPPPPAPGPVLVIGSPFLWWMRVSELRALLAPVVAGTAPSAHPDIAAARRCVRGLDAAAAAGGPRRPLLCCTARLARLMLRAAARHAAEMERGVAAAASAHAQRFDPGPRPAVQEQVGLAYAGWDRLLTRVASPAWRAGRRPVLLNEGVVAALTELSRRDRLAEGFAGRLAERSASELLADPGAVDREVSLLAARLFAPSPPGGAELLPVEWPAYPAEVVDRIWRERAGRLAAALGVSGAEADGAPGPSSSSGRGGGPAAATLTALLRRLAGDSASVGSAGPGAAGPGAGVGVRAGGPEAADVLAARVVAETARAARPQGVPGGPEGPAAVLVHRGFPAQPPRTGRELLVEHIAAAVCRATADATGARAGLDWLDGPVLLTDGERRPDLVEPVQALVDSGDSGPLLAWLADAGVRGDAFARLG